MKCKKLLTALLAGVMVLGLAASAAATSYVTEISKPADLVTLANQVNSGAASYAGRTVTLTRNITADAAQVAIGTKDYPFQGTFDGNGHQITLNMTDDCGLFGWIGGNGMVKDLTVAGDIALEYSVGRVDPYDIYHLNIGGIAANNAGLIDGCTFVGSVTGTLNSFFAGINADQNFVTAGGIVGYNKGKVRNCAVTAEASVKSYINIEATDATGAEAAWTNLGGIVGMSEYGDVENCYNAASVSVHYDSNLTNKPHSDLGGIAGQVIAGELRNCYSIGALSGNANHWGGVAGYLDSGDLAYSYYAEDTADSAIGDTSQAGTPLDSCGSINHSKRVVDVDADSSDLEYTGNLEDVLNDWVDDLQSTNYNLWITKTGTNESYPIFGDRWSKNRVIEEAYALTADLLASGDKTIYPDKELKLYINKTAALVNSQQVLLDAAPYLYNYGGVNYTMVPLRFVGEQGVGASVNWTSGGTVSVAKNGKVLKLTIGQVNKAAGLYCPAQTKDGRTFVPIRYVAQNLGCTVNYTSIYNPIVINVY